jgi:hypothetical protein
VAFSFQNLPISNILGTMNSFAGRAIDCAAVKFKECTHAFVDFCIASSAMSGLVVVLP